MTDLEGETVITTAGAGRALGGMVRGRLRVDIFVDVNNGTMLDSKAIE